MEVLDSQACADRDEFAGFVKCGGDVGRSGVEGVSAVKPYYIEFKEFGE